MEFVFIRLLYPRISKFNLALRMESDKKIGVIDFGGQYSHLIASRVRRLGAYTEICSVDDSLEKLSGYAGLILSGGPSSVYFPDAPSVDRRIFELGVPILGICYGLQVSVHLLGGIVEPSHSAEYGPARLFLTEEGSKTSITQGMESGKIVWMSHGDEVKQIPEGFTVLGKTESCANAMIGHIAKQIYGIQFHPEVTHTEEGSLLLKNFIQICKVSNTWSLGKFIEDEMAYIRKKVGEHKKVFMLVSGGVDSSVAYLLLARALGKDRVKGLLVDTGFMRKNEVQNLKTDLEKLGFDLWVLDASESFYRGLERKVDPEEKRLVVGNLFLESQKLALEELDLNSNDWILGQGTIYPDTIESGGTKLSHKIKTHHNRVPAIQKLLEEGRVIEPLKDLYKDEVRELGNILGLSPEWTKRHPFPGPGLVVRMIATQKEIPKNLEQNILKYLNHPHLDLKVLPFPSVGVQGDQRTYANCILLNDFTEEWDVLDSTANRITNHFRDVNRVVFAPGESVLPHSYSYTNLPLDKTHADLLREADDRVYQILMNEGIQDEIWQMPVVLVPCGKSPGNYSIILRPVKSNEAMTASFYRMDRKILSRMKDAILEISGIDSVFFDLTNKPPGTIEWE